MSIGLSSLGNELNATCFNAVHQQTVKASNDIGFNNVFATKEAEKVNGIEVAGNATLKDMWNARFPGSYYHTLDVSGSPAELWDRLDFPFERFYTDNVDESVLNWSPCGPEPQMSDRSVQASISATLGKNVLIVPPALEEKMSNDPVLAQKVMNKVTSCIAGIEAQKSPDCISSYFIVLDENGDIDSRSMSESAGRITGSSEEEIEQFKREQEEKVKRRQKFLELNEEAVKRQKETSEILYKKMLKEEILNEYIFASDKSASNTLHTVEKAVAAYEGGILNF